MRPFLPALAFSLLASSCAVGTMPPASPPSTPRTEASAATKPWPCAHATKANLEPGCFAPDAEQRRRVGTPCELHPSQRLLADTVAVSYGFVGSERSGERPGLFTHSRLEVSGGCVMGRPFTEVAYCPECRRVRAEFERRRGAR